MPACVHVCVCMPRAQKRYHHSLDMFFHLAFFLLDRHYFGCQSSFFLFRPFCKAALIHRIVCASAKVTHNSFNQTVNKVDIQIQSSEKPDNLGTFVFHFFESWCNIWVRKSWSYPSRLHQICSDVQVGTQLCPTWLEVEKTTGCSHTKKKKIISSNHFHVQAHHNQVTLVHDVVELNWTIYGLIMS